MNIESFKQTTRRPSLHRSLLGRTTLAVLSLGALSVALLPSAQAGCAAPDLRNLVPAAWTSQHGTAKLLRVGYGSEDDAPAIVGLWKFTMTSKGNTEKHIPDGALLDEGYSQWHGDGTELMNSNRDPSTSNFCMGVWKQVGRSTFVLNHFALAWNPANWSQPGSPQAAAFLGPVRITATIVVGPGGDSFKGNFTLTQYGSDETTVLAPTPLMGEMSGKRVKLDSPASL